MTDEKDRKSQNQLKKSKKKLQEKKNRIRFCDLSNFSLSLFSVCKYWRI